MMATRLREHDGDEAKGEHDGDEVKGSMMGTRLSMMVIRHLLISSSSNKGSNLGEMNAIKMLSR